jgi:uncharacterized protein
MKLGEFIIRFRWLVIIFTLFLTGTAAYGVKYLSFSTDYRIFFSDDNPQLKAFNLLQNTYTQNDNVYFAVSPENGKVFDQKILTAIKELTQEAWQIPFSLRVSSLTNFQNSWSKNDDLIVEDLITDPQKLSNYQLGEKKKIALNEPLLVSSLVSGSAQVAGVNVVINLPGKSITEVPEVADYVRKLVVQFSQKYPDIKIRTTGMVMINDMFVRAGLDDMKTLLPMMYGIMIGLMIWLLRSFSCTLATLAVITLSCLTGLGLGGWLGLTLTPLSANAPTIIAILAIANSIHILTSMLNEMNDANSKNEALKESLRINIEPIMITSITTTIGFLSLNFADAPPYRDLGNVVAMGVAGSFFISVLFLPALLSILPCKAHKNLKKNQLLMVRLGSFVTGNQSKISYGMLALVIFLTLPIFKLEISDIFPEYFDDRYTFRTDNDFIIENITGFQKIEYSLGAGEEGGVANPEYLLKLEEFANWYRKQFDVVHVKSFSDIMKRLNRNMHGDNSSYYRIPESRELAAQYLLLLEMSLPLGKDLGDIVNISKSATRFTVTFKNPPTRELLKLENRAQEWLRSHAPGYMFSIGASPTLMFAHIAKRNVSSMMVGTVWALVMISGILMLVSRSFKYGLISLVPNLIPALLALGLWGLISGKVGLASSVVIAISLGIIVDDTVHFLSKYLRARRNLGKTAVEAVHYSFHQVGSALWFTSAILVSGFVMLAFSGFEVNSQTGTLVALTIFFALLTDFLFLPALLIKIDGDTT